MSVGTLANIPAPAAPSDARGERRLQAAYYIMRCERQMPVFTGFCVQPMTLSGAPVMHRYFHSNWRSLRDYSALRASPFGPPSAASGVQIDLSVDLSNSCAGWRPREFSSRRQGSNENAGDAPVFSFELALPTRFELVYLP